jgi:hypothetical protein
LQAFDLDLTPGPLFVFRVKLLALNKNLCLLHGECPVLREDESFQGSVAQGVEIRKGGARGYRTRSMPDILWSSRRNHTQMQYPRSIYAAREGP